MFIARSEIIIAINRSLKIISRKAEYCQGMFANVNITCVSCYGRGNERPGISQTELDNEKYETRKS